MICCFGPFLDGLNEHGLRLSFLNLKVNRPETWKLQNYSKKLKVAVFLSGLKISKRPIKHFLNNKLTLLDKKKTFFIFLSIIES